MICEIGQEKITVEKNGLEEDESGGLFCSLYKPDVLKYGTGPYPTIVSVYGGDEYLNFLRKKSNKICNEEN